MATNAAAALETQPSPKDFDQPPYPCLKIISVASIAAGIQFGWALQLSLRVPNDCVVWNGFSILNHINQSISGSKKTDQ